MADPAFAGARIVLLGTSKYSDERLPAIPVAGRCLDDLRAVFTDPETGLVRPEQCTVLLDEVAMPVLGRKLNRAMAGAEDLLVVYYVGHGIVGRRHELYLGMPDSDLDDPAFGSLPYVTLRDRVLDSPAATKIVVLDCCYSGRAMGEPMADPVSAVVGQLDIDGTYLLTSAQRDQVALVLPGEDHTAFTGRLLRLMRNGVPDGDEYLTIDDLYRQLSTVMTGEGLPRPQKRGTRTADRFRIIRNQAVLARTEESLDERFEVAVERGQVTGYATVVEELREVLAAQRALLGDTHVKCIRTSQHLALAIGAAGDPRGALKSLRNLLDQQLAKVGPDDRDTLRSRQFIAVNTMAAGEPAEALRMLRVLLPDRRRVLGPEHPETVRTQHLLARVAAEVGDREEAVALLADLASRPTADPLTAQRVLRDLNLLRESEARDV
ncbi:tetratricopeptide repeat protein [Actinosynnema sp. NPDC023658]|uniref:caspase family protein n=1 Tax=Actinosynnema sp. NPDC023658 TaxID=3155465 RepID=UPI0033FABFF5